MGATEKPLTPKQRAFVAHYLISLNASEAARQAGFSARTAGATGHELLKKPEIAAAIEDAKRERSEATKIDAEWVLRSAVAVFERCFQEVRPALHPKTRRQMKDEDGNPLFVFNAAQANRALELIGKHVSVNAWAPDQVNVDHTVSLVDRIQAGRRRLAQSQAIDVEYQELPEPEKEDEQ